MSLNLVRNSRVFFTTNVNAVTGVINPGTGGTTFTSSNTFELQVLDGFSFSQNVNSENVTVSEAGQNPTRGQRSFNTSLAPVDFSMSTYIRPFQGGSPFTIEFDEQVLWNALMSDTAIAASVVPGGTVSGITYSTVNGRISVTGTSFTNLPTVDSIVNLGSLKSTGADVAVLKQLNSAARVITSTATSLVFELLNPVRTAQSFASPFNISWTTSAYGRSLQENTDLAHSKIVSGLSEKNQLQKFGLLFLVDTVLYAVDNCALNQVTIDFGLDQIATAQWTGQATALRELSRQVRAGTNSFSGGTINDVGTGTVSFAPARSTANYITNKLSTASLKALKAIGTSIAANDNYVVPLTGGSITINNNISYITPAILGVVNTPVTYFTGVRAITGTLNCYLRTPTTGTTNTGELFKDMIAEASAATAALIEPMFEASISIGGSGNTVRVDLDMPAVSLGVPSVNVEQIVSLSINFTAQGYLYNSTQASQGFDLTQPNELTVSYFA